MIKRAPGNVRYLGFGENILTRSFTARDPQQTSRAEVESSQSPSVQNAVIPNTSGYAEWGDPELNLAKRYDMLPEGAGDTSEGTTEARKLSE